MVRDVTPRLDADEVAAMAAEARELAEQAPIIAARRQHIRDTARCVHCGVTRAFNAAHRVDDGLPDLCPEPPGVCRYVESRAMLDKLFDEIVVGRVLTVAEAFPARALGPRRVSTSWLLYQDTWWYPKSGPAVRIDQMDKPWRLNTARFLERKAEALKNDDAWTLAGAPDDVWASWLNQSPAEWLAETPLMQRLWRGLPTGGKRLRMLEARALHWSTCPMRKAHPGALDRCRCERDGSGRAVGGPAAAS